MKNVLGIKKLAKENENFRKVVLTGKQCQMVVMNLAPGDQIGEEIHATTDQLFFVEEGHGELVIDNKAQPLQEHEVGFVPAGTRHNVINAGKKPLRLFTVYSPPVHAPASLLRCRRTCGMGRPAGSS